MSLFKRSVIAEILSHAGVVFSTLIVVWLSVLLVRLLGQAAAGSIGADVVLAISAFSSITALPIILIVSLFIAILTTISRNYREQEMFVWFSSGVSLVDWVRPVLVVALPVSIIIAILTVVSSPWAYRQAEEYRQRYAQRADYSKVVQGQFIETASGSRVFFIEPSANSQYEMGSLFARELGKNGVLTFISANHADFRVDTNSGERFIDLGPGSRYDLLPNSPEMRLSTFDHATLRLENNNAVSDDEIRYRSQQEIKARPLSALLADNTPNSDSQIMWRFSLPLAALNLALLAIPLGSVNPRMGKSGNVIIAALVGLLYMNLLNIMRGWISAGKVDFWSGLFIINGSVFAFVLLMFWLKMRVKAPKQQN
ncbi:LPS export ABC transporter permease LptF [Pelistega europaea]|uniref:Lipopolysaccharide export system permease protein LptF n=1 Tax=Pelistega europaea TaxID=106147 RepID=A0A7Y4LA46_9BURK|nr:LPS export ABC transporter permease LptF [Pelistega europaea]NOL49810.1 LPS export ABC transporter permease LptF [Pelistega europaea]